MFDTQRAGRFLSWGFRSGCFFWLIIGYFQQGKELKLNQDALTAQVVELRQTVEQQRVMADAARESLRISVEHFAEAAKAESRRWQPIFKCTSGDAELINNDEMRFNLNFTNLGQDVSNVLFFIDEARAVYMHAAQYGHDIWGRGEKVELSFYAGSDDYPKITGFVLGVVYHDVLGEKQARRLVVSLRGGRVVGVHVEHVQVPDSTNNLN